MEIVFVIFQFHYRNRQQELMDHKREICCWNNDYLLYLTNLKRGRYNPSVTQREKVNGWESDVEFTWRKFTAVLWIRNNVTGSQDKIIKCAMFYQITKEGLVIGWFPDVITETEFGVQGICQGSTAVNGRERYRIGWQRNPAALQAWQPSGGSGVCRLMSSALSRCERPPVGLAALCGGRHRRLLTWRLFPDHTPHTSQWASPSLKWDVGAHLCLQGSPSWVSGTFCGGVLIIGIVASACRVFHTKNNSHFLNISMRKALLTSLFYLLECF